MLSHCVLLWSTNERFLVGATPLLSPAALVIWARSHEEATEKSISLRPDIVVIDGIPGIDNPAAARALRG